MDHRTALAELAAGNARYVADARQRSVGVDARRREELVSDQTPFAAVLGCADSRVVPEYVFDQSLGDLFVTRVAGNVAAMATVGSLEFAAAVLEVPVIVVLGHEGCGAVTAALDSDKPQGDLGVLIDQVEVGNTTLGAVSEQLSAAVEQNAKTQAARLVASSEVIGELCRAEMLRVVAAVYELESGRVRWV